MFRHKVVLVVLGVTECRGLKGFGSVAVVDVSHTIHFVGFQFVWRIPGGQGQADQD